MLVDYFSGEVEVLGGKGVVERWPGGMGRHGLTFQLRKIAATLQHSSCGAKADCLDGIKPHFLTSVCERLSCGRWI